MDVGGRPVRDVTVPETRSFQPDGTINILGGRTLDIDLGSVEGLRHHIDVKELDGSVLTRGLFNGHTHLAMEVVGDVVPTGIPLERWLPKVRDVEMNLTSGDVGMSASMGAIRQLDRGVTAINDMYFDASEVWTAVDKVGLSGYVSQGMADVWPVVGNMDGSEGDNGDPTDIRLRLAERMIKLAGSHEHLRTTMAPHSDITTTDDLWEGLVPLAQEASLPIHCHVSETMESLNVHPEGGLAWVMGCIGRYGDGVNPSPGLMAVHCSHLTDDEWRMVGTSTPSPSASKTSPSSSDGHIVQDIAQSIIPVLCPTSNRALAGNIPDPTMISTVPGIRDRCIFGTDGSSHPTRDIRQEPTWYDSMSHPAMGSGMLDRGSIPFWNQGPPTILRDGGTIARLEMGDTGWVFWRRTTTTGYPVSYGDTDESRPKEVVTIPGDHLPLLIMTGRGVVYARGEPVRVDRTATEIACEDISRQLRKSF